MTCVRASSLAMLLVAIVGLAACDVREAAEPIASGERREPRIVALLPFAADQLIEMGVTPVGVPQLQGEVPEPWRGIPTIAVDHSAGPNLEQVMAASPDIVIASGVYAQFLPVLEQSTGAEIVVMDVDSIQDVRDDIAALGAMSGHEREAAGLIERLDKQLDADAGASTNDDERVSVLAIFGTPHSFYAFLPDSYLGDLIEHSGGELITDDMPSHSVFRGLAPLSMETVIDRDPDQILVLFHGPEESARAMLDRDPLWSQLTAVRAGNVSFLKDDLYAMRPGSELPRALTEVSSIMEKARNQGP